MKTCSLRPIQLPCRNTRSRAHRALVIRLLPLILLFAGLSAAHAQLTREQAVAALLSPASGVPLDTNIVSVWCPYFDTGAGVGREGLLPVGSSIAPAYLGAPPFPGSVTVASTASYFFWIDDVPTARFEHAVRFVIVKATVGLSPTVASGGITVSTQGWWPIITLPPSPARQFFSTLNQRATFSPPSFSNLDGLVAGTAPRPSDILANLFSPPKNPPLLSVAAAANQHCGLIVSGSAGTDFDNDVKTFERDLTGHYGVPADRVVKANGGAAASSAQLDAAITALCALVPPCDKIFIRVTSHAGVGTIALTDGTMTASNLCERLKKIAAKGVPICMLISACHSESLVDAHRWNFPAGSWIGVDASSNRTSWGGAFVEGTYSLFAEAFSQCLNANPTNNPGLDKNGDGMVSDPEAFDWATSNKLCVHLAKLVGTPFSNIMIYPAKDPTGLPEALTNQFRNPQPKTFTVGPGPSGLNANVCNGTGAPKTDFHIVFKGNVTGGTPRSWVSDSGDHIGQPWAGGTSTYDSTKDETTVSYTGAATPAAPGQVIHFGYAHAGLRPIRQYWTPTTATPATIDQAPVKETSILVSPDGHSAVLRVITRSVGNGGWGQPLFGSLAYRLYPQPIPLDNLNFGTLTTSNPPTFLNTYSLQPDVPQEYQLTLPSIPGATAPVLVLFSQGSWSLNQNQAMDVQQFDIPIAAPVQSRTFIERYSGNVLRITWTPTNAVLQSTYNLFNSNSWQTMPSATTPYYDPIQPSGNRYYRVFTP